MIDNTIEEYWMEHALSLAKKAEKEGEVPVGACLVRDNTLIGEGWNQSIRLHDPSAHAEIMALREGANNIQNYRLVNTTLYVTLEPCLMCAGAMLHARIERLVYAASDPKGGAVDTIFSVLNHEKLNHRVQTYSGLLQDKSSKMLKLFFQAKRKRVD